MTDTCPICQHARVQAINSALDSGRYLGLIARQFRLDFLELDKHRMHRLVANITISRQRKVAADGFPSPAQGMPLVMDDPLSQFEHAWQMAHMDPKLRRSMIRLIVGYAVRDSEFKRYLYELVKDGLHAEEL